MKQTLLSAVVAGWLLAGLNAAQDQAPLNSQQDKVSYSIGLGIGKNLKQQSIEVDVSVLARGIMHAYSGQDTLLTEDQVREVMTAFQTEMRQKQERLRQELAEKNKRESAAFFAKNSSKPGVVTRESGLQYEILNEGTGQSPTTNDLVVVNYRGTLLDGTEFDSSERRGQAQSFSLKGVIEGWAEAFPLMKEGGKWMLYIPPHLGYREFGNRAGVGPNAGLIFEVELVEVKQPEPPKPPKPITSDIIKVPSAEGFKRGEKIEIIKPEEIEKKDK